MYSDDEQEVQMIGVEVVGGVKKDRELAEEIVWFCLEKMLPRHRTLNITVLLTKTYEEGAKGFRDSAKYVRAFKKDFYGY